MNDVIRLLSFSNFKNNPKEVWDFIHDLMNIVITKKQNEGHKSIEQMMKMKNIKTTLITQNIDGFHNLANKESDDIYEIHGNGYFYRCDNSEC